MIHVLMRDEKEGRSKQGQTNNEAKQHSTPKAVTFPKKNEPPEVGLKPTTLHTLDRALYQLPHAHLCLLTSSSPNVPTRGEIDSGMPSGTKNSNAFGPCGRMAPLMTGLLSRLSLGFEMEIRAVAVSLRGVVEKFTTFSDNLRAGKIPLPLQAILKVLRIV